MDKLINFIDGIFRKLGYVPHDSLMNELIVAGQESYKRKEPLIVVSKYYKFKILMVDVWEYLS